MSSEPTVRRRDGTAISMLPFIKGHGTGNDFVVVPDPDGVLDLSPEFVAAVCDRRTGVGADGLLRVVRSAALPQAAARRGESASDAPWFMDYRNGDGSVAEMCGNGVRVFARYLVDAGLARPGEFAVGTRDGAKRVRLDAEGDVTVDMGSAAFPEPADVKVRVGHTLRSARNVSMGNPHAVVFVDDLADAGELRTAPAVEPAEVYPQGVNVEYVVGRGDRHIAMRVFERGAGETRSCGTGACAAMVAAAAQEGRSAPVGYTVDVPGGRLSVLLRTAGHLELTGPAVLVAEGELWVAGLTAGRSGVGPNAA